MPLQRRCERFVVIMMCKHFHDLGVKNRYIQFWDNERPGIQVMFPSYPSFPVSAVATQYDALFAYVGSKLWNMVPAYLRIIRELGQTKMKLNGFVMCCCIGLQSPATPWLVTTTAL